LKNDRRQPWSRHGRDRMVVGFTTTYAICAYHHWCCESESCSGWCAQHYVITFVSDFLWFPPPIKLTATNIWNVVESGVKHYKTNQPIDNRRKYEVRNQYWLTILLVLLTYQNFCDCIELHVIEGSWHIFNYKVLYSHTKFIIDRKTNGYIDATIIFIPNKILFLLLLLFTLFQLPWALFSSVGFVNHYCPFPI
jgi:hypothetical protein